MVSTQCFVQANPDPSTREVGRGGTWTQSQSNKTQAPSPLYIARRCQRRASALHARDNEGKSQRRTDGLCLAGPRRRNRVASTIGWHSFPDPTKKVLFVGGSTNRKRNYSRLARPCKRQIKSSTLVGEGKGSAYSRWLRGVAKARRRRQILRVVNGALRRKRRRLTLAGK